MFVPVDDDYEFSTYKRFSLFPDCICHPNKMFSFPIAPSLVMVGRSIGQIKKRMKTWRVLGSREGGLQSKKAWFQSQLENVVFSFVIKVYCC